MCPLHITIIHVYMYIHVGIIHKYNVYCNTMYVYVSCVQVHTCVCIYTCTMYTFMYIHVHMKQKLSWCGQTSQQSLDSGCFELVSSHQQGIRITCLAHHPSCTCTLGNFHFTSMTYMYGCLQPREVRIDLIMYIHVLALPGFSDTRNS